MQYAEIFFDFENENLIRVEHVLIFSVILPKTLIVGADLNRLGSNEYTQSMFWCKNRNNVYPFAPQFYYIKWGSSGNTFHGYIILKSHIFMFK